MGTTLTPKIAVNFSSAFAKDADAGNLAYAAAVSQVLALANGVAAGQVDQQYVKTVTIAGAGNQNFDLAGSLTDPWGATITMGHLKAIVLLNVTGNVITLSRPASNGAPFFAAAGDAVVIPIGGMFVWVDPVTGVVVTAATGDLVNVAVAAGAAATFTIVFLGTST